MGFFDNVKKGSKSYLDAYKKSSSEKREYQRGVNEEVKKARREAFKKEAIKQAGLRAKLKAKQVYNPSPQQSGGMSTEARSLIYGSGSPTPVKQQVIKKIIQTRSPKKKKKRVKPRAKTKTIVRYIKEKQKPVEDPLKKLLRDLPQ